MVNEIRKVIPNAKLVYNNSPSFPTYHTAALSTDNLAQEYFGD